MTENKVELLGYYGSDKVIACSAWTSTSRDLDTDKEKRIPKLIDMLWREGHETPFEKATVHFLINTDIATHIHLLKHRMSSLNAESARYKELKEDKYYIPSDFNTVFNSDFVENFYLGDQHYPNETTWANILEDYTLLGNRLYHQCLQDCEKVLGRKRAKESSRFFKTYNSQIQSDVSFNMRSFANFLKLRKSKNSQLEIRELAEKMYNIVYHIDGNPFKETMKAINKHTL